MLALPLPEQPVIVTVATEPETVVVFTHPVFVPLMVVAFLTVVAFKVPGFASEKVKVYTVLADEFTVVTVGPVITRVGAMMSLVTLMEVEVVLLPDKSVTVAVIVCAPAVRAVVSMVPEKVPPPVQTGVVPLAVPSTFKVTD